ncbi:Hypothetical protein FKW44_017208 [Caligus rogercresseyi]|uniref:Uncharacterized protein n=1 Tax=Caligus rogercresseyi TaxID=217165 RepID=A0A7T8H3N0_CALRO|nr:Hypothetical protein FKW44_017208 [Caligus rogercresseyi]
MIGAAARYSALSLKIPKVQNRDWNYAAELIKYVLSTVTGLAPPQTITPRTSTPRKSPLD